MWYIYIYFVIRNPSIGMSLQQLIFSLTSKLDAITSGYLIAFPANNLWRRKKMLIPPPVFRQISLVHILLDLLFSFSPRGTLSCLLQRHRSFLGGRGAAGNVQKRGRPFARSPSRGGDGDAAAAQPQSSGQAGCEKQFLLCLKMPPHSPKPGIQ